MAIVDFFYACLFRNAPEKTLDERKQLELSSAENCVIEEMKISHVTCVTSSKFSPYPVRV